MTTVTTTDRTSGNANGTAPIPFTFQALSAEEIAVTRNDVVVASNTYTVTLNGDGTGSITPLASWGTDAVVVYSNPSYQQPANFERFGAFYPDQINPPLDRAMRTSIALRGLITQTTPQAVLLDFAQQAADSAAQAAEDASAVTTTSELLADQALLAQAAALASPTVYATTAAGLAATADQDTFWINQSDGIALYRDNAGVAVLLGIFENAAAFDLRLDNRITRITKNLYDYTKNTAATRFGVDGSRGANVGTQTTALIPVLPSTDYSIAWYEPFVGQEGHISHGYGPERLFFDANKNAIAGTWGTTWPATTTAATAYIGITVDDTVASYLQLEKSSTPSATFTPYGIYYLPPTKVYSRKYEGKTVAIFGDSLSREFSSWWQELLKPLGFINDPLQDNIANPGYSVAGRSIANRPAAAGNDAQGNPFNADDMYTRRGDISLARDVVFLFGGTNDWSSPEGSTFGTMASRSPQTFYGALHLLCQYFVDNFPGKDIFFVTPTPRVDGYLWSAYSFGTGGVGSLPAVGATPTGYSTNPLGKTLEDYANAMLEVCEFYGIPCVDVFHKSLLRVWDETERAANMGDHVHPTTAGQRLLGRQVLCAIEQRPERP